MAPDDNPSPQRPSPQSPSPLRVEPPNIRLDLSWPVAPTAPPRRRWARAVVAVVALATALGAGLAAGRLLWARPDASGQIAAGPGGAMMATGPLALALERQLASEQRPSAPVAIGITFAAADGAMCRTFVVRQTTETAGLACRARDGWRVRLAVSRNVPGDDAPAPVLEAVDQIIRGAPLDATSERAARDAGWIAK